MNSVITRTDPNVREFPAIGPGERLRSARLAHDMDLQQVAAELHLTTDVVNALEHDDYDAMPARVFVRGYLKNYARVVGLPEEVILQLFDEREPVPEEAPVMRRTGGAKLNIKPLISARVVRLGAWVVVICIVAVMVLWIKGYLSPTPPPAVDSTPAEGVGIEGEAALPDLAPPGELTLPYLSDQPGTDAAADDQPVTLDAAPPLTDAATSAADSAPKPGATAGDAASETTDSGSNLPTTGSGSETLLPLPLPGAGSGGATVSTAAAPAAGAPVPASDAAAPVGIVFEFSGECWVDVRDRDRKFKMIGKMSKGTRRTLRGTPPYDVVIGNVSAVTVTVGGEPFDIRRFARGKVARFKLDPDA